MMSARRLFLIAILLLAPPTTLSAADLLLMGEGTADYQIVVPAALTECMNQTARLVQAAFLARAVAVGVVTESQRNPEGTAQE